jgi:hypothetical protein
MSADLDHRFRPNLRLFADARAQTTGQNDGLHPYVVTSSSEDRRS